MRRFVSFLFPLFFLFAAALPAQNLTLTAKIGDNAAQSAFFENGANEDVTSGNFDMGGSQDWTWSRDGNDLKVFDQNGVHVCTFDEGGNSENASGPLIDGEGAGNYGGRWER